MRERNLPKLFELGLHPFLLVRHVGPVSAASRVIDALLHLVAHE